CHGLIFRIAAAEIEAETAIVWRREMIQGHYRPLALAATTPQGLVTALAFAANPEHPLYVGELPPAEAAAIIASGQGPSGSCRGYLHNLIDHLARFGIADERLEQLAALVG